MKRIKLFSLLIFTSLFSSNTSASDNNKELRRYYKCFSHLVRERPSGDDVRLLQIKAGKLSGVDACMQVFDQAKLNESTWTISNSVDQNLISKQAFSASLHKITKKNCASCHGDTAPRVRHGAKDENQAHSAVISKSLVNFSNIYNSKIVSKVRSGHNCWGNCEQNAQEIANAITDWKDLSTKLANEDLYSDNSGYNYLGKKVLKTFNDFHRTWFGSYNINENSLCASGTSDVMDGGDMAYYVTRAMFSSEDFQNVVTEDRAFSALRYSSYQRSNRLLVSTGTKRKLIKGNALKDSNGKLLPRESRYSLWDVPVVQLGELIGINEKQSFEVSGIWNHSGNINSNFELFENFGAGAISTKSYLIHNKGLAEGHKSDGGMKVMRRWSRAVFNDLFCRDLPVIRNTDAIKYVDMKDQSDLSFRKGISCMQCHATMDPLARVTRGITVNRSARSCNGTEGHSVNVVHNNNPTLQEHPDVWDTWVDKSDKDFFKRPQNGKLFYRTTDGELVDERFEGIDSMGDILARQDDLYRCAAKRYVKFLTGVNIPLADKGDINAPDLTPRDKDYLEFINKLGSKLKEKQDLRDIIKEIVQSDAYINPGAKVN